MADETSSGPGYRTHAIVAGIVIVGLVAGLVGWKSTWGPDARARRVSEILSGQSPHPLRNGADKVLDVFFKGTIGDGPVERQQWATLELGRLAKEHPRSLARACADTTPDVRFAFLDVIEASGPYAEISVPMRIEHAGVHVSRRLDREGASGYTPAQEDALRADRSESLRVLRNAFVAGHCGALVGYDLLSETPKPQDFVAAAEALARSAAQPVYAEMDELAIEHCRTVIARRAAPTTDGGLHVVEPGK